MEQSPSVAAIGHDPEALEAFYREHLSAVQRFVARRVADPHDAADLTADVFMAAIETSARYRSDSGSPGAWLTGIARHVVAMHHRSASRRVRAVGRISGRALLDEESTARVAERIDAERDARHLHGSLSGLPESQRAVVELVAVDGLSLGEAATVLGITPGNARIRYHRARRTLARALPPTFEVTS